MFEQYDYDHSDIPALNSDVMKRLARALYDEFKYYKESRADLENQIWPACDEAYMCIRSLPENEGMDWVMKDWDLGETDIWDGVNFLADSLSLALMPRDESWLEVVSSNGEDQAALNDIRDYLAALHRKSGTRREYSKHLKQVLIRGTGGITWTWKKKHSLKRLGPAGTLRKMAKDITQAPTVADAGILDEKDVHKVLKTAREKSLKYDGPVIRPIDMYDLFLDPNADLQNDDDVATIVRLFISVDDLKAARDSDGIEKYENLDGLEPHTIAEIHGMDSYRYNSIQALGINPIVTNQSSTAFVPVLVFNKMVRRFEDHMWVDCNFYLAISKNKDDFRLIRVEENPANSGAKSLFIDTYHDWISGSAYGIGAVEKSLSAFNQKCVVAALTIQAQMASVFPAYSIIAGMLLNEARLKLAPGSLNTINMKPSIGTNFIAPLPVPQQGQQLGMQAMQFLSQQITGQMGAYGSLLTDPTKTVVHGKTATQINTETTSGGVIRDNFLEKVSTNTLEPLCQAIYDAARQWAEDGTIYFEKLGGGSSSMGQLDKVALDAERRILFTGMHGLQNKAKEIEETREVLDIISRTPPGVLPNLGGLMQESVFRLLGILGVKNLEQYRIPAPQLALQDPATQQMLQSAVNQAGMQGIQQGAQMAQQMNMPPMQSPQVPQQAMGAPQ